MNWVGPGGRGGNVLVLILHRGASELGWDQGVMCCSAYSTEILVSRVGPGGVMYCFSYSTEMLVSRVGPGGVMYCFSYSTEVLVSWGETRG